MHTGTRSGNASLYTHHNIAVTVFYGTERDDRVTSCPEHLETLESLTYP